MIRIILFVFLSIITFNCYSQQNTILIIADDVSPDYFGCFSQNTDTAKAPNVRRLAEEGVMFTKVWATPLCSPTRAGILTGRYSFRTGVGTVITSPTNAQIDTAEMSIAKLLKYHAPITYNTACIGKWHLNNGAPQKRLNPNKLGFDLYSGNFNGAVPDYYNYTRIVNGVVDTVTTYATTQTVNDAIDWMDTMNASKPFFLWLAFNAPHDPYHLPPASLCDTTGLPGTPANINANPKKYFKAAIEAMDTEIGRLFAYLTSHNLMDSTNIIFIGDNGNQRQVAQIANPTKSKGTLYDYGERVPLIVKGPSVLGPGRTSIQLISTVDLFATIAEMSGFPNWSSAIPSGTIIDSKSFLPEIKNQYGVRSWIFTEQFEDTSTADDGKTIRNDDYHLIRLDNGTDEFYNQTLDSEENNNLLLNTAAMTSFDIMHYNFLCDTLSGLMGIASCQPVGIEDVTGKNTLIFPNPVSDFFAIKSDEFLKTNASVIITNSLGQQVIFEILDNYKSQIDVSNLPAGIYSVTILNDEKKFTQIIIKN
jgi:arylsulfatase B